MLLVTSSTCILSPHFMRLQVRYDVARGRRSRKEEKEAEEEEEEEVEEEEEEQEEDEKA